MNVESHWLETSDVVPRALGWMLGELTLQSLVSAPAQGSLGVITDISGLPSADDDNHTKYVWFPFHSTHLSLRSAVP